MENWLINNALYLLVILGTVFAFAWIRSFNELLHLPAYSIVLVCVIYTLMDAAAVKLLAVVESLSLEGVGRLSLFGAVLLMPITVRAVAGILKILPSLWSDICTPCFVFMFMMGRVSCLITGCCVGTYMTDTVRWPVREAEIAFYIVLLFIFCIRLRKGKFTGMLYPVFLISYGTFRFAIEWLRYIPGVDTAIHPGHIWALVSIVYGSVWLIVRKMKNSSPMVPNPAEKG